MKLSKGQGLSIFVSAVLFGVFSIIVFLAPLPHTVTFWLGYFFALFALFTLEVTAVILFGKTAKEEKFLHLPAVRTAWGYFVLQTALSVWQMFSFPFAYMTALTLDLVIAAVFVILILFLFAAAQRIDRSDAHTAKKVLFVKQLGLKLNEIETADPVLSQKIRQLAEDVRFADPMSHSELQEIEARLAATVDALAENAADPEKAAALCDKAAKLMKNRGEQCRMLKGVKDSAVEKEKSGSGIGFAFAGVGALLAMVLITLAVCFFVIPQSKYDNAAKLMKAEHYDAAEAAFSALGNFRDSEAKIDEIHTIRLDAEYEKAEELQNSGDYAAALAIYENLNGYKDAATKIEEINNILLDTQYEKAEQLFNNGDYTAAMSIYSGLNGYKNSSGRIEEISNRLSTGNVIYFGSFNGKPVAWRIIKTEDDRLLLLADQPVKKLPMHSEMKAVDYSDSSLKKWLNETFVADFAEDQIERLISTTDGDKVFLFDQAAVKDLLSENVDLSAGTDWWIAEKSNTGFMYVTAAGELNTKGDLVVRDKGVRPAIWLSLK